MKSENYLLEIGSKTFVPGFEDQLIGLKKGETKDRSPSNFPKLHAAHLAGKDVEFTVTYQGNSGQEDCRRSMSNLSRILKDTNPWRPSRPMFV